MPPKKARKKKPFEKVMDFRELYDKLCEEYSVEPLDTVCEIYDDLITKEKALKKLPLMFQFAEEEVPGTRLRPFIQAYQESEVRVRFLSFLNTKSGDEGLHVLATALVPPLEIAGLAYHANEAGPSGCRAIARGMIKSEFLAVLELDFNPGIGDEGIAGLCHYGHCKALTKLSLRFCDIGDKGAETLGKWLSLPDCNLKELLLQGNKIGPAGVTELARYLPHNKSLNRLDLSDNLFGYDAAALNALIDGVRDCEPLNAISLLNQFECPEGLDEKFLDLTTNKPLGECVVTPKMDSIIFQNIASIAMANKKKIAKAMKAAAKKGDDDKPEDKPESHMSERAPSKHSQRDAAQEGA